MGGGKVNKGKNKSVEVFGIEAWGPKGVQMIINKLIHQRYDHEIVIDTLKKILDVKKWDDTNFISFESFFLRKIKNVKSHDTRMSYQVLWKRYLEKKATHKIGREVSMFSDDINRLLESPDNFASGNRHEGVGAYSIGK